MSETTEAAEAKAPVGAWITARSAGEIAGLTARNLKRLAAEGRVRVRKLPGAWDRYALADVQSLAAQFA